ncbi:MFS transporter [Taibaiella soli]|uniref:MFS transporter n=1 Tax=Taibaiella soli TaxID=1649169 RepID=A0A2W2BD64_9BACT|nr:MFS transporter [Taibaiella soli]PZF74189.1 MFS transporter [Taibaiella soli]
MEHTKTIAADKKVVALFSIPVLVAALGYFVDIYDLLLFGIIRIKSLRDLGLSEEAINIKGTAILNYQMFGLLIGGIIWGVLGDKKGRLSVLFGSILLYSVANICNGLVHTIEQYSWCRFIAGIGLAGELGAGITLVSELLPKEKRGIATSMVAGIGLSGAILAYFIAKTFSWQTCYFIGGGLGLCLLLLRVSVFESGMFKDIQHAEVKKGNFFMFFSNGKRLKKYLCSILIGLPTWYVIGILITFSNKFAKEFGITEAVDPGKAIMLAYVAISIGDVLIGFVSHWLKSRKKALFIFYGITAIAIAMFFNLKGGTASQLYWIAMLLGFGTGFWAIFVTMAAEQFGTNLRATAATTVPNMVRGSLPLMSLLFQTLQPGQGYVPAAIITGIIVMVVSIVAALMTEETFGKDLNFLEY